MVVKAARGKGRLIFLYFRYPHKKRLTFPRIMRIIFFVSFLYGIAVWVTIEYAEMVEWSIAAVLKTSFVCLCNFLKTLDFIGFFASSDALCEKPFSQFSRKFP